MKTTVQGWRIHRNITQKKMAEYLGISEPTYIKYEKDPALMKVRMVHDISRILEIDSRDIIFFDKDSKFSLGKEEQGVN
jgi:DNA-binding XRE family transcriptional regulator